MKLKTIKSQCSQFLEESKQYPLLKNLSIYYEGFKKVKIRHKKINNVFVEAFNQSFYNTHKDLFNRAIFANGMTPFNTTPTSDVVEPFYIFPINGYNFLYNPLIFNSENQYLPEITKVKTIFDENAAIEMFKGVILSEYKVNHLDAALKIGAEVIFYGIPFYYAIRKSLVDDYKTFVYDN
jgi:hypothetical protein